MTCDCSPCEKGYGECKEFRASNVATLLSHSSQTVSLIVGPSRTRLSCHKALLGYYSDFFFAALYGGFKESDANKIELPEENVENVKKFIGWVYTGDMVAVDKLLSPSNLENSTNEEKQCIADDMSKLWVLGDKFLASIFKNNVMLFIMGHFRTIYLTATVAEYVYAHTFPGSNLRNYIRDLIVAEGPYSKKKAHDFDQESWDTLLQKGVDLVVEVARAGGFANWCDDSKPYKEGQRVKYLQLVDEGDAEKWLAKKNIVP